MKHVHKKIAIISIVCCDSQLSVTWRGIGDTVTRPGEDNGEVRMSPVPVCPYLVGLSVSRQWQVATEHNHLGSLQLLCSCSVHLILILMVWIRFIITLLRNDQLPGEGIKYCNYPIYKILSNWEIKYIKLIFVLKIWRVLKLIQDYDGFDSDENWSLLGLTFYWYAFNSSLRL